MKSKTAFIFIIFSTLIFSQTDPKVFLAKIPQLPDKPCSMTGEQKSKYLESVRNLHDELSDEINKRRHAAESNAEGQEEQVKKNLAKQYGLSDADLEQLKNKKHMTDAEKKALVDKMMKSGMNANVDQKKSMDMYKLAQEQKSIIDKISSRDQAFRDKLDEQLKTDTTAESELKIKLEPLFAELHSINDGEGSTEQDVIHSQNVQKKIRGLEEEYCSQMTPGYYKLLSDRLAEITTAMPEYRRLEEVTSQLNKNTTGIDKDISAPGLMELEAINDYVSMLDSVFKYVRYSD